jgi:hypothetical protein
MNEKNNSSATVKITGSLNWRILITTAALGVIILVTSIAVVSLAQMQVDQDYLAKKKAILAYIQAKKNISSYSEESDYLRH